MQNQCCPRILVVDDLMDYADSCALLLSLWGYDTSVCYYATTVLEAARSSRPQVVLLDIAMPRLDGFQLAQRLRSQPEFANTVLIGISGFSGESYRRRAQQVGFDYYLLKPVCPEYLQQLLGSVIPARLMFDRSAPLDRQLVAIS
jgi:CheY-like chemotaxis protein